MDPFVLNLLTAVAVFAASLALGGWLAWRRHRARAARRDAAQQSSRKQDTEST